MFRLSSPVRVAVVPLLPLWLGCGAGSDEVVCDSGDELVNWQNFGAGFFAGYCRSCHAAASDDRRGAPAGLDFDTEAQVALFADSIREATLVDSTMPVGGGVQQSELDELAIFLDCGL